MMTSFIKGYNYDIFISYRQKDNKGDHWVSEFVEALKTELESTFKEEISVYFDTNPHDGLLETYDVDASLKEKLKCLIFIPIISRTYCDPKSFAWEHEFKAFVEMVSKDQFGLKVKLPNGNVSSRILPVQIHDLKSEDKELLTNELGSFIRAIEFIYKESGVNRPLTTKDSDDKNTNKTNFRNQINKVANAIDEIISGLKGEPSKEVKEKDHPQEPYIEVEEKHKRIDIERSVKANRIKIAVSVGIVALFIIAGVIAYPKIFKSDTLERLRASGERISVVVMPFQNMTNDTIWNVWQDGIQDMLITFLSNSGELIVRQSESIGSLLQSKGLTNYASITPAVASKISKNLKSDVFICGNIIKSGDVIRLYAKLTNSKTEEIIKSFQVGSYSKDENILTIIDSLSILLTNFLVISKLEKEEPLDHMKLASTSSPVAYRYFLNGNNAFHKGDYSTACSLLSSAIAIDSTFTIAKVFLCFALNNQGLVDEAKKQCLKLYEKRDHMTMRQKLWTNYIHSILFETVYEQIKYLKQFVEYDDQVPLIYTNLGSAYITLHEYDKAIPLYEKALDIYTKWNSKPIDASAYYWLGYVYHKTGQYKKERDLYKKAELNFPNNPDIINNQAVLSLSEGDTIVSIKYIEKYTSIRKENSWSEVDIETILAEIYTEAGNLEKAEKCYRQTLKLTESESDNSWYLNNLAYFLIDKDRNINEGMELINKALVSNPENYDFLKTKGWGLYKQSKYKEALEILQKSWDLRMKNASYDHPAFLHLEVAKKAVLGQLNN
ncbi:MAG: tetratricopeptide repeat protein [Methanococcaceae archaeon]